MRSIERQEKEVEILPKNFPHSSSRLHHNYPHGEVQVGGINKSVPRRDRLPDRIYTGKNDPIRGNGNHDYSYGGGDGWYQQHARWSPSPLFSDMSSGSGSLSPVHNRPGLGSHSINEEHQIRSISRRFQSMYLESSKDAVVNCGFNPPANYTDGDAFGMPHFSVPSDPLSFSYGNFRGFEGGLSNNGGLINGFNPPANYTDGDAFGMSHFSVPSDPHSFSSGNFRGFEGGLSYNGGLINQFPVNRGNGHGFIHFQYPPTSISGDMLGSQMVESKNYSQFIDPVWGFLPGLVKPDVIEPIEAFKCEESIIIQGRRLNYAPGSSIERTKTRKNYKGGKLVTMDNLPSSKTKKLQNSSQSFENLMGVKGYVYHMAKDPQGSRFLQHKFQQGKWVVDLVFSEVVDHTLELIVDHYGNYVIQKLLEVGDEEQHMRLVALITEDPTYLIKVSLDAHGTRVVQTLIKTLSSRHQINLVISALKPGIVDLMKDFNGSHVVQQCLQTLRGEDNKFIFEAATAHCVEISMHQLGCCFFQRCIDLSAGDNQAMLVAAVSSNGFLLAQHAFGNYVVQYVIEHKIPSEDRNLALQFEGRYVELSKQKFSSHVVQRCLEMFGENDKAKIIIELLSVPRFDQLVQHPYANYVIQTAFLYAKGSLRSALIKAIKQCAQVLRMNPHCKWIFSGSILKK